MDRSTKPRNAADVLSTEFSALREEMRVLKDCQLQYFTLAVLAAGAILGTNGIFATPANQSVAVLAPLLVVLPCWLVFFDKATTITRMAAYVRLLEGALLCDLSDTEPVTQLCGFETALRRFRTFEDAHGAYGRISFSQVLSPKTVRLLAFGTRHRYWVLNWWTFFLLSAVCTVLPFALGVEVNPSRDYRAWLSWACVVAVTAATLFTLWVFVNLNGGCYSYDNNEKRWRQVFEQTLNGREDR